MKFPLNKLTTLKMCTLVRRLHWAPTLGWTDGVWLGAALASIETWAKSPDEAPKAEPTDGPVPVHRATLERALVHLEVHRDFGHIGTAAHQELCALTEELSGLLGRKDA